MPARWEPIPAGDGTMRAYLGVPDDAPLGGLLVAHHGPGLDGFLQDVVNRLFREGFVALAPDLYHRQPASLDTMTRVGLLRDAEILTDLNAALTHLRSREGAGLRFGTLGFCMGGRVAYRLASATALEACTVF